MSAYTIKLSDTWDLTLDASGKIATAAESYAIAQNVANACRLFTNDAYYDTERGIPHFNIELGAHPQLDLLRSRLRETALEVDGVESAAVTLDDIDTNTRTLTGEISLTLATGDMVEVTI